VTYPGGKAGSGTYQKIINQIPPHLTYVEPFLGGGAILLAKKPALCSIGIDTDPGVVYVWQHQHIVPELLVFQGDGIKWLEEADLPADTFIYCDPPYLFDTRKSKYQLYLFEMGEEEQHIRLLDAILKLNCMVMISGYYSDLYAARLHDWRVVTFEAVTRGGTMATEYLWMNYPEPMELHDYRYIGDDFRERERIKRKITRWKNRLTRMDPLERQALLVAIDETRSNPETLQLPPPEPVMGYPIHLFDERTNLP
jgi:DNA adenine methylase